MMKKYILIAKVDSDEEFEESDGRGRNSGRFRFKARNLVAQRSQPRPAAATQTAGVNNVRKYRTRAN